MTERRRQRRPWIRVATSRVGSRSTIGKRSPVQRRIAQHGRVQRPSNWPHPSLRPPTPCQEGSSALPARRLGASGVGSGSKAARQQGPQASRPQGRRWPPQPPSALAGAFPALPGFRDGRIGLGHGHYYNIGPRANNNSSATLSFQFLSRAAVSDSPETSASATLTHAFARPTRRLWLRA